jgi:hypothetical protein
LQSGNETANFPALLQTIMSQEIQINQLKILNAELIRVCKELRSDLWYQLTSKHLPEKVINYPSIKDADTLLEHLVNQ